MSNPCDRPGIFRASIVEYGLRDADQSQSVAVVVQAQLLDMWNGEDWDEWAQYDQVAQGDIWIIKKDGSVNTNQVEALIRHAGWDGTIESIANRTWQPVKCQVVVKEDRYKDEIRYRVEFINAYDRTPGAVSTVTPEKARDLATRHGAALRAVAANARRNAAAPANGKPAAPPPAAGDRPQPPPRQPAPAGAGDEIPF